MKSNRKIKLNFFDIAIIVVALLAGFIVLRLTGRSNTGGTLLNPGTPVTVQYTLELFELPIGSSQLMSTGDKLMEIVEKRAIGTVTGIATEPCMRTSKDNYTGDMNLVPVLDRETVVLTVELDAVDSGTELNAGGFVLRTNQSLSVSGPGYYGVATIVDIDRTALEGK